MLIVIAIVCACVMVLGFRLYFRKHNNSLIPLYVGVCGCLGLVLSISFILSFVGGNVTYNQINNNIKSLKLENQKIQMVFQESAEDQQGDVLEVVRVHPYLLQDEYFLQQFVNYITNEKEIADLRRNAKGYDYCKWWLCFGETTTE